MNKKDDFARSKSTDTLHTCKIHCATFMILLIDARFIRLAIGEMAKFTGQHDESIIKALTKSGRRLAGPRNLKFEVFHSHARIESSNNKDDTFHNRPHFCDSHGCVRYSRHSPAVITLSPPFSKVLSPWHLVPSNDNGLPLKKRARKKQPKLHRLLHCQRRRQIS